MARTPERLEEIYDELALAGPMDKLDMIEPPSRSGWAILHIRHIVSPYRINEVHPTLLRQAEQTLFDCQAAG